MSAYSAFTSRVTKVLEIPHDPDQRVTIRKLTPRHLDQAAKASQRQSLDDVRALGGMSVIKEIRELSDEKRQEMGARDPLLLFDRVVLMKAAVKEWTYQTEPDTHGQTTVVPIDTEHLEDLDDETSTFICREILQLSKPSLFETKEETEATRKNASSPSVVH